MSKKQTPTIVTIGKATEDVFLRSQEFDSKTEGKVAYTHLPLGAKLNIEEAYFDTGGNATNVAVTLARQGLDSHFIWALGQDPASLTILRAMDDDDVNTSLVDQQPEYTASYSAILLSPDGERTILNYHGTNMDKKSLREALDKIGEADWLYPSSLGDYELLDLVLRRATDLGAKIMLNPAGSELDEPNKLKPMLEDVDILVLNKEEMSSLVEGGSLEELVRHGLNLCPVVIVSDGPNGVCASDGKTIVTAGMYEDIPVIDRTGAGDAFAAGFLSQWVSGKGLKESIIFASANSTAVVAQIGAKTGILGKGVELHNMPITEKEL